MKPGNGMESPICWNIRLRAIDQFREVAGEEISSIAWHQVDHLAHYLEIERHIHRMIWPIRIPS
jgi:hypothetical protein